ncbi:MAG: hypothetical protein MK086_03465 [Flavobacteriales bacterium]|nr:hypothetical protein [Flavobacteriales bacterium]
MLSRIYLTTIFSLFIQIIFAQAPQGINYQAVLRDADTGEAFRNEMVVIIITVRQGGPNGTVVYTETHSNIVTSEFGIINLLIGNGDINDGDFPSIPWSQGDIWYEVEVDKGSGLESFGSSQFQSVPYALYSGNGEISLDNDPTNELITSAEFNPESNTISLQQADGSQVLVSLSNLNVDDLDADPANELIDPDEGLQLINSNLRIVEAGIIYSVNLSSLQNDNDSLPTNELIDESSMALIQDTILVISEAGIEHTVNLAPLRNDDDWKVSTESQTIFNTGDLVGIGTDAPEAKLEVVESDEANAVLNVVSGTDTVIYAQNRRLGIGTSNPLSAVQISGSVGYDVTVLSNVETNNYIASIEDHMIVVTFQNTGNEDFSILLPSADVCEGRVYFIRKTGAPGAVGDVTINTAGFPVDFDDPDLVLTENGPETTVLLSLGNNGWTRILRED